MAPNSMKASRALKMAPPKSLEFSMSPPQTESDVASSSGVVRRRSLRLAAATPVLENQLNDPSPSSNRGIDHTVEDVKKKRSLDARVNADEPRSEGTAKRRSITCQPKVSSDNLNGGFCKGVGAGDCSLGADVPLLSGIVSPPKGQHIFPTEGGKEEVGGSSGSIDKSNIDKFVDGDVHDFSAAPEVCRKYAEKDKGKGKLHYDSDPMAVGLELEGRSASGDEIQNAIIFPNVEDAFQNVRQAMGHESGSSVQKSDNHSDFFREAAKRNASRFARYNSQEEEGDEPLEVATASSPEQELDDWPGPFSTAMKIIRGQKASPNKGNRSSDISKSAPLKWHPKNSGGCRPGKREVPLLQDLAMSFLASNVEAVTSLENIPDEFKHKLCNLLCDSRSMTTHLFSLLLCGSPTEVCIKDCSWLREDDFTRVYEGCDAHSLSVLQLGQCGRCITDYVLRETLARGANSLLSLTRLSLKGACRLSDDGLTALLSAAPLLRSLDVSQCSLLSSSGIAALATSHGSVLEELFLNDCQGLDATHIIPTLKNLQHLEVLSLTGIQSVSDSFIKELITARGESMKGLLLAECFELTDSSLEFIARFCPKLCSLDLTNILKLTDLSIRYISEGCRALQILKFGGNLFSDEAMAALLETSGHLLTELSLNNVRKAENCVAMSIAKNSVNLEKLDLSFCRKITDNALGLIVDSCSSLRMLKLFGCTQVTEMFLNGHSNMKVKIIGLKLTPILG